MKAIQKAKPEAVENQLLKSDDGGDLDAAVVLDDFICSEDGS